jgi:hypothetical protein
MSYAERASLYGYVITVEAKPFGTTNSLGGRGNATLELSSHGSESAMFLVNL